MKKITSSETQYKIAQLKEKYPAAKQFAKGKRSIVFSLGKSRCIKLSLGKVTLDREYKTLQLLNRQGIGPKAYSYDSMLDCLEMERIYGKLIEEFASQEKSRIKVLSIIYAVAKQLFALDQLSLSKEEMHHPAKHIIISEKGPVLIDFERCHYSGKPKNITQFFQYLTQGALFQIISRRGFVVLRENLRKTLKSYKEKPSEQAFYALLSQLCLSPKTDFEKIYTAARLIPKGKLATYKSIATVSGTLPRVVGFAMSKNPFAPIVPCHRVVASSGIGGFASGIKNKKNLLISEGISPESLKSFLMPPNKLASSNALFLKKLKKKPKQNQNL
jgi:methylated-DNA-[protein]-cysteine S-methyltransferase